MSNNKKSMKLYTEDQVVNALQKVFLESITFEDVNEVVRNLTPIELPSEEEIREERLLQFPDSEYANRANDRLAFYCGARMVINKIQGGNK
jgi:hypothetical protein